MHPALANILAIMGFAATFLFVLIFYLESRNQSRSKKRQVKSPWFKKSTGFWTGGRWPLTWEGWAVTISNLIIIWLLVDYDLPNYLNLYLLLPVTLFYIFIVDKRTAH